MSENQITEIKDGLWRVLQSTYIDQILIFSDCREKLIFLANATFHIIFWKNQLLDVQQKLRPNLQNQVDSLKHKCGMYSRYLKAKTNHSISSSNNDDQNLISHHEAQEFIFHGFDLKRYFMTIAYDPHFSEIIKSFDSKTEDIELCYSVVNQIEVLVERNLIHLEMTIQFLLAQIEMVLANVDQYTDLSFEPNIPSSI